ncbi:putative tRNA methyltransferase subunit GCD14 [Aspergillus steynii IBT 23096]|uniref:tRNA (adenine(58)-N(1))-methyltransferase catalytic subunit TRM61 n=1 Tax=Aspergillus steynii IBT 23096 TaxID=1392250 RepID=A0A2I2FZC3_9EURO|nr:putative tRNA methyltransferase subunit GCD14 [Aspergillus steynii IBT 23096]PLB45978.1 putative tRNA methyltransferase subunit GCD14 [Aspergillus steynii IBT 23096]
MPSPFLTPGAQTQLDTLALLHLRRDQTIPALLRLHDDEDQGYSEGKVVNTRFGSFPHSTLAEQPWGSQIVASKVDTGSRGRRDPSQLKRKADDLDSSPAGNNDGNNNKNKKASPKVPVAASSGFLHVLAPTPELWTASLPHRTQVVYTPDYSYILHRLCVRPGSTIIEAGAGSGSFTHASVRAVFNGYPGGPESTGNSTGTNPTKKRRLGKVCSFEFHAQRAEKIRSEVQQHGLDGLVEVTHRDVYGDGFLLNEPHSGVSPKANAVFLDLPAPWHALKHLVRHPASGGESPLDPSAPVYLCTFSPCMEQVQRTISTLRQLGWLSISMVEVDNHRIDVKRERNGLEFEGAARGAVVFPKSVEEAVARMRMIEERSQRFRATVDQENGNEGSASADKKEEEEEQKPAPEQPAAVAPRESDLPFHEQGRLVHRSETDLKTHTSYLVFAVLPREWTEEDEQRCREKWPSNQVFESAQQGPKGKRQQKRDEKERKMQEKKSSEAQEP